ncbi:hypothetical protein C4D60_Mb06t04880 [Musa balbisiana]|uniref:Uncharacterized protein n=1 Tax=Musa balbisiana TaxID=52838 RepID=A0A4S8IKM8_MUSBA|nr:hypothetical protein C4D60_Mb06t04880 [Musa balbisiana]
MPNKHIHEVQLGRPLRLLFLLLREKVLSSKQKKRPRFLPRGISCSNGGNQALVPCNCNGTPHVMSTIAP